MMQIFCYTVYIYDVNGYLNLSFSSVLIVYKRYSFIGIDFLRNSEKLINKRICLVHISFSWNQIFI